VGLLKWNIACFAPGLVLEERRASAIIYLHYKHTENIE
jgi:hypothetical protein